MIRRALRFFFLPCLVMICFGMIASADSIDVGILSYDAISSSQTEFDITNLTGLNSFPSDFPITSDLTFTVDSLVVNFTSGPSLTLPGSDFSVVDAEDDLDCAAGSVAACNLFGDSITSATLTGTFSPTTGLAGLTSGTTGIEAAFTVTITPSSGSTLIAGTDDAIIDATTTTGTGGTTPTVPEPGTWQLVIAVIGIALIRRGWAARLVSRGRST